VQDFRARAPDTKTVYSKKYHLYKDTTILQKGKGGFSQRGALVVENLPAFPFGPDAPTFHLPINARSFYENTRKMKISDFYIFFTAL
jgi:hypothetical protein